MFTCFCTLRHFNAKKIKVGKKSYVKKIDYARDINSLLSFRMCNPYIIVTFQIHPKSLGCHMRVSFTAECTIMGMMRTVPEPLPG